MTTDDVTSHGNKSVIVCRPAAAPSQVCPSCPAVGKHLALAATENQKYQNIGVNRPFPVIELQQNRSARINNY